MDLDAMITTAELILDTLAEHVQRAPTTPRRAAQHEHVYTTLRAAQLTLMLWAESRADAHDERRADDAHDGAPHSE